MKFPGSLKLYKIIIDKTMYVTRGSDQDDKCCIGVR
jgi:hypothetical protein